jgi:DNA-binding CsgD family transcriptional regulator
LWTPARRSPRTQRSGKPFVDFSLRRREVVCVRYIFDLEVREIAQLLDLRKSTVRSHLTRAHAQLLAEPGAVMDIDELFRRDRGPASLPGDDIAVRQWMNRVSAEDRM